jgi:hypothetical protein
MFVLPCFELAIQGVTLKSRAPAETTHESPTTTVTSPHPAAGRVRMVEGVICVGALDGTTNNVVSAMNW